MKQLHFVRSAELTKEAPKQIKAAKKGKATFKRSPTDPVCVSVFLAQLNGLEQVEHKGKCEYQLRYPSFIHNSFVLQF